MFYTGIPPGGGEGGRGRKRLGEGGEKNEDLYEEEGEYRESRRKRG